MSQSGGVFGSLSSGRNPEHHNRLQAVCSPYWFCIRMSVPSEGAHEMAYVVEKAGFHYAVIYEGVNPITGSERRRWHRCGDRADAEALACRLSAQRTRARRAGSLMTLADYLLGRWLPVREAALSPTTFARYVTSITHYLVPHLGHVQLRQLHADQLASLYRRLALDGGRTGRPLAGKTILNLHQLVRAALDDAVARELILHNPATDV